MRLKRGRFEICLQSMVLVLRYLYSQLIQADHWGYKKEAYGSSVHAAELLTAAGVKVAFKSDHPVLNAQHLVYEAAKAHSYGLNATLAIQAITSVPAGLMGVDDRIGYIRPGYDADMVIWNKSPLEIGAHPVKVYVDGYQTFTHPDFELPVKNKNIEIKLPQPPRKLFINTGGSIANGTMITYTNIGALIYGPDAVEGSDGMIVVQNNITTCIGPDCTPMGTIVDLQQGWVIPVRLTNAGHHSERYTARNPRNRTGEKNWIGIC